MIRGVVRHNVKLGGPVLELRQDPGDVVIFKAYASPDGKKIRVVVPEFLRLDQASADPEKHIVEFRRK